MAPKSRRERGMVALLLLVLLATVALTAVMARVDPSTERDLAARKITIANLEKVETALAIFTMQNRRLPCPASGEGLRATSPPFPVGTESRLVLLDGSTTRYICQVTGPTNPNQLSIILVQQHQTHGIVPWRTLGLRRTDVIDGWGNFLSYRVHPELVKPDVMDLSSCHPNGTGPLASGGNEDGRCKSCVGTSMQNCTPPGAFTLGKGLRIVGPANQVVMDPLGTVASNNGAAYVVVSHGENGAGAYSAAGVPQAGLPAAGTNEGLNFATATAKFGEAPYPSYFDGTPSFVVGSNYFDDLVLRPRVLDVANAASLGPRMR